MASHTEIKTSVECLIIFAVQNGFNVVEISGTSLPIAIGLWGMMWPVLAKVRNRGLPTCGQIQRSKAMAVSELTSTERV